MKLSIFTLLTILATSVSANLLENPDFDLDPTISGNGWTAVGTGSFLWNQSGGDPSPPSARTNQFAGESMILYQCVGIVGGTSYDFSARSFTHSSIGTGTNGVRMSVYSSNDCSGLALETVATDQTSFPDWALRERNGYIAPASASSARIELYSEGNEDQNQISWDNVIVDGQPSAPPAPATPVPTMSVWGLAILAGLLGYLGYRRRMK